MDNAHHYTSPGTVDNRSGMYSLTYEPQERAEDSLEVWSGGAARQIPETRGSTAGCALPVVHRSHVNELEMTAGYQEEWSGGADIVARGR